MQVWLWKVLWSCFLVQFWSWYCWLSFKIHFLSHIPILSRNQKDNFFDLWLTHEALSYWDFFTLPICFKCWITIEKLRLSFLATSHVVVRGSASVMALRWLLSISEGWSLNSSSKLLSPLQNFLNHHCTVCSLAVPGPVRCWCYELSLLLYDSFWAQVRKSFEFAFCLT